MALVDDLILSTESLLQNLRAMRDIRCSSHQPVHSYSASRNPPETTDTLQNCRNILSIIISDAQALLGQLPHDGRAAGQTDTQQLATASVNPSPPSQGEPSSPSSGQTDTQQLATASVDPSPPSQGEPSSSSSGQTDTQQLATASVDPSPPSQDETSSSSDLSEIVENLLQDNSEERADHSRNNTSEVGQSEDHHQEQHGSRIDCKGVRAANLRKKQMRNAMVTQLEKLAAAMPSSCYDKVRIVDFEPPDFSQAQTPASGYMTGSIYSKDGIKVTALSTEVDFAFPSADILSRKQSPLSFDKIRSSFQSVVDHPPDGPLPYFVGPIPMPAEYIPLVDAGLKLRKRNNGNNIPGVNTPYWYISQCAWTAASLHIEDCNLGSVNLLLAGAPKIWLFIPEFEKTSIERRIMELYGPRLLCSQRIRHCNAIIPPALLEKWGITYYLDCCLPGEMIVTRQNTYHQVLNTGPNIAESVNFEFSDTPDMPLGYVWCKRGSGPTACGPNVMTPSDFSSCHVEKERAVTHDLQKKKSHKKRTQPAMIQAAKRTKPATVCPLGRFTEIQIRDKFAKKLAQADDHTISFFTRMFFAVASPVSIKTLQHVCFLRRTGSSRWFAKGDTTAEAMEALDRLEKVTYMGSIVQRYYLVCLFKQRNALVRQHKLTPAIFGRTRYGDMERIKKAESLALQDLYYEVFNTRDPAPDLEKKLKNRLYQGRNWTHLTERFSVGILALLPTGQDVDLFDSQIERAKDKDFLVFLDILQQERGDFVQHMSTALGGIYDVLFDPEPIERYKFEKVDQLVLDNTPFDGKELLRYCTKI